jgi:hypothetical protein
MTLGATTRRFAGRRVRRTRCVARRATADPRDRVRALIMWLAASASARFARLAFPHEPTSAEIPA